MSDIPILMRLSAIAAFLCLTLTANAANTALGADVCKARPQFSGCVFSAGNMPDADSCSNAMFRNCRFVCSSDTLFLADHADQMVLIDCDIIGDGMVMWSRFPQPSDRNYQYGLYKDGIDFVIDEGGASTIELEGLELAGEFFKPVPEYATMLSLSLDTLADADGRRQFVASAATDCPLPAGFLGWHSSDARVMLFPMDDGTRCRLVTDDKSVFGVEIGAYGLNGVESAVMLTVRNGEFSVERPVEEMNPVVNGRVKKGFFRRIFKRHRQ